MKINKKVINKLNPCIDRYNNYLKYYGHQSLTKAQFMGRRNITQADKLWVAFRLMPKKNVALAAADIAESVLHIFEKQYPNDLRPRKAIEAARGGAARAAANASNAAYAAANTDYADYADYAVDAASNASNAAADAAANAARAAANASNAAYAASNAAYAAAYAVSFAASNAARASFATKAQEKLIRKIVLKWWKD